MKGKYYFVNLFWRKYMPLPGYWVGREADFVHTVWERAAARGVGGRTRLFLERY